MKRLILLAVLITVAGCSEAPAPTQPAVPQPEPKVNPPVGAGPKVKEPVGTPDPSDEKDDTLRHKDTNFSLKPPPMPWVRDGSLPVKLGAPYIHVYRRENPEGYVAFGARDYGTFSPPLSELDNRLQQVPNFLLAEGWKKFPLEGTKTWMGQEARGYRFTGVLKTGGAVEGEVRAVRYKGVGYWFTAWTSAGETYQAQKSAFADAREGCKLLDPRKDWVEKAGPVPFRGETVNYTILDAEGIWYEASDSNRVKGEDPKADKLLRTKKLRNRPEAELLVLVLDANDKPLAHARAYIEAQANLMPDVRGKNTFTEHGRQLEGNPIPLSSTVDGTAEFVLLKSVNSLDPAFSWLYAVSAIKVGDKTVAVCAKCKWSDRAAFDTTFVQIVKSLREK